MGENDTSKQDPLAAFDASESAEQSQERENSFTKPSEGSFSTLSSDQADITEYQETGEDTKEASTESAPIARESLEDKLVRLHAMSKIVLAAVIVVCLVFVTDGLARSSASGSPLLRLPFFQHGNILCNRVNGGVDTQSLLSDTEFFVSTGNQDLVAVVESGSCLSRAQLLEIYEEREEYLQEKTGAVLAEVLPKKFSFASFTQSPLFRFIQSHAPDRRVDHAKLIKDVLGEVQKVDETQNMHLFCQRILFEDKVAKMSCLAQGKGSTTSRDVALKFLEGLTRHPSILIVDHPTSVELRQLDDDESGYETETILDVHVIQRSSGFEIDVLPRNS